MTRSGPQADARRAPGATLEPATLTVDGRTAHGLDGEWLADLLDRTEARIPHVCYHPHLGPVQTCDTCYVRVDGHLARACATPVRAGMAVTTRDAQAVAAREEGMHRLLGHHNLYCTVCDRNNGDCDVHNATSAFGLAHQRYDFRRKPYPVDDSHPFYRYDPDQCILCGRCVEACQNVQVTETLSIDWEADVPRVVWDGGVPAGESSCVGCGHCVTVCPCNALMEKTMIGEAGHFTGLPDDVFTPAVNLVKAMEAYTGTAPILAISDAEAAMREASIEKTKTVCTYCGVGCTFDVWTRERHLLKVLPTGRGPANGISTCVKGKFGWDFVNSPDRLRRPLIRRGSGDQERFEETTWDEALDTVAARMRAVADAYGPDSVAFIATSKATNEESYLVQKMARAVFGTNNVDNCSRYCQSPATMGLFRTVGYGGDAGTMDDIEASDLVLIVGSNTAVSHPVLAARIRRQQKRRGQQLIVADLRRHEMARRADVFLRPAPGTDLVWLSAVTKHILDEGLEAKDFLRARVNGLEEYRASLAPFTLEYAQAQTGIPAETLRDVARRLVAARTVCALWAMGVTQHTMGSDTSTALSNLLLVTGNYGRPGAGAYPLRGHNNVQGCSDFGSINTYLPGYQRVEDDAARARYEAAWGVTLPATPGLDNRLMIDAIYAGTLKAVFLVGEEIALVDANAQYVQDALARLDFFCVQDLFFSTTARFADVVLAACPSLEKDGTFTNTERRLQRLYRALPPYAESRPDWAILTDLAARLGHRWGYTHPSEIMDEAARTTPLFAGVSYDRLEGYASLCWPVAPDGTDTPLLYTERFAFPDGRARLYPLEPRAPTDQPDADYDLHLNNGRVLEHFHEGNMTLRSTGLTRLVPGAYVEVSEALAQARGLETGDWVRLVSRRGAVRVQALVSEAVQGNELYMPMTSSGDVADAVNVLTSNEVDAATHTPAYKEVAVRLEKLDGPRGKRPLPATHHRYGHPTPQRGVEVERKWDRPDYALPILLHPPVGYSA